MVLLEPVYVHKAVVRSENDVVPVPLVVLHHVAVVAHIFREHHLESVFVLLAVLQSLR